MIFASTLANATPTIPVAPDFPHSAIEVQQKYQLSSQPKITQKVDKIVAYFDGHGELVDKPVARGYYRVHLGNVANGRVVQDFYVDTKRNRRVCFLFHKKVDKILMIPKFLKKSFFIPT